MKRRQLCILAKVVGLAVAPGLINQASQAATDPRGPLFSRTDLVFGSQIGAWNMDGGPVTDNPTAFTNAKTAGIRVVRFQMFNRPAELGGTESTATFNQALDGIYRLGAFPMLGLPPNSGRQLPGGPQPWSYAWQQWVVSHGAAKGVTLFEMGNEPNNAHYGDLTPMQYFSNYWVNVPRRKEYARALGYEVHVGGPAWMNWSDRNVTNVETFLSTYYQTLFNMARARLRMVPSVFG